MKSIKITYALVLLLGIGLVGCSDRWKKLRVLIMPVPFLLGAYSPGTKSGECGAQLGSDQSGQLFD